MVFRHLFVLVGALFLADVACAQTQPAYEAKWEVMVSTQNDTLISTVVDLGLKPFVPAKGMPYHLSLGLVQQKPKENGLVAETEAPDIEKIQNNISNLLMEKGNTLRVGITTFKGVRTLHFYAQSPVIDTALLHTAFIFYPQYKNYRLAVKADSSWSFYLNSLYPSPAELQKIQNNHVVESLIRNGDHLNLVRPVDHFLSFPTKKEAEAYFKKAKKDDFTLVSLELDSAQAPDPTKLWQLRISRPNAVTPVEVDRYTLKLWGLATQYHGIYNGWQTVAVRQTAPTVPR